MTLNGQVVYIEDGYTQERTIPAEQGAHGALKVTYRPMLVGPRAAVLRMLGDESDAADKENLTAQKIAEQIVAWDVKAPDGSGVRCTAETVQHIEPRLFYKLRDLVFGISNTEEADEKN